MNRIDLEDESPYYSRKAKGWYRFAIPLVFLCCVVFWYQLLRAAT